MARTLIRIDKNGTKYWSDDTCRRCCGQGALNEWAYTGYTCWECGGTGHSKPRLEKEYTPEYEAKLTSQRLLREAKKLGYSSVEEMREAQAAEAARKAEEERLEAERIEAERKAKEKRIKAAKAISQFVGTPGEKLTVTAVYEGSPYFERRGFGGYGTERVYIHRFRADGNLIIWKSSCGIRPLGLQEGETVVVTGTVKEHSEYKDEKQTIILRAKVKRPVGDLEGGE